MLQGITELADPWLQAVVELHLGGRAGVCPPGPKDRIIPTCMRDAWSSAPPHSRVAPRSAEAQRTNNRIAPAQSQTEGFLSCTLCPRFLVETANIHAAIDSCVICARRPRQAGGGGAQVSRCPRQRCMQLFTGILRELSVTDLPGTALDTAQKCIIFILVLSMTCPHCIRASSRIARFICACTALSETAAPSALP